MRLVRHVHLNWRVNTVSFVAIFLLGTSAPSSALADCVRVGSLVTCNAIDFDGFLTTDSGLELVVRPDALVRNISTGRRRGNCPLSFPAVSLGNNSTVTNDGRFLTFGVCGTGIEAGADSTVVNNGQIETNDILAHGIAAAARSSVINRGSIATHQINAHGVLVDDRTSVENTTAGVITTHGIVSKGINGQEAVTVTNAGLIETTGQGGHGIDLLDDGRVTNSGIIRFSGFTAVGIRMSDGSATVTNTGTISGTYEGISDTRNPSDGIQITGTSATIINQGSISLTGPLSAGVRVSSESGVASISNTGQITAERNGINVTTDRGFVFVTNSGIISALSPGSAGVLLVTGVNGTSVVTNSGIISGATYGVLGGQGRDEILNSGVIANRIALGEGNDRINLLTGSLLDSEEDGGLLDGGGGIDELVLSGSGVLTTPIVGFEELLKFGQGTWRLNGSVTFRDSVRVAEDTLSIAPNTTVTSSRFTVFEGGILELEGTAIGEVENQGTLVVGSESVITGTFRQIPSGILTGDLSSGGLVVNGSAAIDGEIRINTATLPVIRDNTVVSAIQADSLTGSVNTVTVIGNNFVIGQAILSPTTLDIRLERRTYETVAQSNLGRAMATALDVALVTAPDDSLGLIRTIDSLSQAAAANAFDSLATSAPLALTQVSLLTGRNALRSQVLSSVPDRASGLFSSWGFGQRYFGSFDGDSDGRYKWRSTSIGAGLDYQISEAQFFGVSVSHADSTARSPSSQVESPLTFFGLRYGQEFGPWAARAGFVFSSGTSQSTRLGGLTGTASLESNSDNEVVAAAGHASRTVNVGWASVDVSTGLLYVRTSRDHTQELGTSDGALSFAQDNVERTWVDTRVRVRFGSDDGAPWFELGLSQALSSNRLSSEASLLALPEAVAVFSLKPEEPTWVDWALHVPYAVGPGVAIALNASGVLNDKTGGMTVGLKATLEF